MPVGKMSKSGSSFTGAAEYDLAQGKHRTENRFKKPVVLEQNLIFGHHFKEIGHEFRTLALENKKCSKPVMKFAISFDPKEDLSDELKLKFTKLVIAEMGITEDHQYLITRHQDKAHDHHHILANRVGCSGKVISNSYAINKLETSIDKIEKLMGMQNLLAKKRRYVYDENNEKGYTVQLENFGNKQAKTSTKNSKKGVAKKKTFIQNQVDFVLINSRDLNSFYMKLQQKKIEAEMRFNNDKLVGISFNYDNFRVKGSALGTAFKAANIERKISLNLQKFNERQSENLNQNQQLSL